MPPANDGTAQIVASLEEACRDLSLPADARALFARAREAYISVRYYHCALLHLQIPGQRHRKTRFAGWRSGPVTPPTRPEVAD